MNPQSENPEFPRKADLDGATRIELLTLCERLCDGVIMPEEFDRLEAMIVATVEARAFYIDYVGGLHGTLRWMAATESGRSMPSTAGTLVPDDRPALFPAVSFDPEWFNQELLNAGPMPGGGPPMPSSDAGDEVDSLCAATDKGASPSGIFGFMTYKWFALSWMVLLLVTVGWMVISRIAGREAGPFATLVHTAGCVWSSSRVSPQEGDRLKGNDEIELIQGVAELEFDNGTRVVLEGPIQVSVTGPDGVLCRRGTMVAFVPSEAIGFTVGTPLASVVDLGTEFGVAVADDGESEVHVFKGAVQLETFADENENFTATVQIGQGEARRVNSAGEISKNVLLASSSFIRSSDCKKVSTRQIIVSTARGHGADTFIRSDSPNNFGGETAVAAKATYKFDTRRKAWIRFDIADPNMTPSQLRMAALQLTMDGPRANEHTIDPMKPWDFEVWGMKDVRHGVTWDARPDAGGWVEGTGKSLTGTPIAGALNWANAGGNNTEGEGVQLQHFTLLGSFRLVGPSVEGQKIELSTSALRDFIADDSNGLVTLVILRTTPQPSARESTIHWFASKEHGALPPPQLKLDFDF